MRVSVRAIPPPTAVRRTLWILVRAVDVVEPDQHDRQLEAVRKGRHHALGRRFGRGIWVGRVHSGMLV